MKKYKNLIVLLVLIIGIVVISVVINHREQTNVVTVDKVEVNGNLHYATVRSRSTRYTVFCQDIPAFSCLQLHVGEKYPFQVAGTVLYFSQTPQDVEDGWRIDKEEKLD